MQGRNPATWLGASVNIAILRLSESSSALSRVLISSSVPSRDEPGRSGVWKSPAVSSSHTGISPAQPSPALIWQTRYASHDGSFRTVEKTPIRNSQSLQSSFGSAEEYGNNEFPSKGFLLRLFPGGRWIWFAISPRNPTPLNAPRL